MVRFSLLGPLLVSCYGRDITPQSFKVRAVLALLLLRAGNTVDLSTVLRRVWECPQPATAVASARNIVSALRRALAEVPGVTLDTIEHGYRLVVPPAALDVTELEALLARGQSLARSDDPESAAVSFRRALDLWHGSTLVDLTLDGVRWTEIERLEERRAKVHELCLGAELACGRHRDVLPELEGLVREHPGREELHRLRMVALHRCGRRGDAAEAYGRARDALRAHAGRGPGEGLQDAHEALLATPQTALVLPAVPPRAGAASRCQQVRRSDIGAAEPTMPRPRGTTAAVLHEVRAVAVLCVRGPRSVDARKPADEGPWRTVHKTVDAFGGARQPQDGGILVAYFGLLDPVAVGSGGAAPAAPDQAAACALAVRGALLRDRRRDGDLAGHLHPLVALSPVGGDAAVGPGRRPYAQVGHALGAAPAPVAVVVTTGTILRMVHFDAGGRPHTWVAGDIVDRCTERARNAPDGAIWIV